jgi:DNA-binding PadR family transcriptional regulator
MFSPLNGAGIPSLSAKEAVILRLLMANGELFGLQLVEKSDGELKRGTVYVTLDRMQDKGFVTSRQEARSHGAVGIPRRLYQVTGLGQRVAQAYEAAKLTVLQACEVMS